MLDTYMYRAKQNGEVTAKLFDSKLTIPKDWHDSPKGAKAAKSPDGEPEEEIDLLTAQALEQGTLEIIENDDSTGHNQ